MTARRLTSIVILIAFLALGVLSFLGNRWLSVIFIVVAGTVLAHHAVRLCPRCSNTACAFNPRHSNGPAAAADRPPYSNLKINRSTVFPLVLAGPLAIIAAWQYSPVLTVVTATVALTAHFVFRELTCKRCGNDCAGNCNSHYRAWRASR